MSLRISLDIYSDSESTTTGMSDSFEDELQSKFSHFYDLYNPNSTLYTNAPSDLGITKGLLKFIIQGVGVTSLCVFGAMGNLLSILVLCSPRMGSTSTSYYLLCLAICDVLIVLCSTLVVGIPSLLVFNPDGGDQNTTWLVFNERIVKYSRTIPTPIIFHIGTICFTGSVLFTMALTMDRYLAICKPFLTLKYDLCSRKKARYVSAFLIIADILYNLPRFWEIEYEEIETKFDSLSIHVPLPTTLRRNFYYDGLYKQTSYIILLFLVPFVYLVVLNVIIYQEVGRSRKLRSSITSTKANPTDTSLVYMLFGIVIGFLLCQAIPVALVAYRYATGHFGTAAAAPEVEYFLTLSFVLNSSVNFFIYCVSGSKFRNAMIKVLNCNWRGSILKY